MMFASIMIVIVLIDEIYIHYREYGELNEEPSEEKKDINIWDLNM